MSVLIYGHGPFVTVEPSRGSKEDVSGVQHTQSTRTYVPRTVPSCPGVRIRALADACAPIRTSQSYRFVTEGQA